MTVIQPESTDTEVTVIVTPPDPEPAPDPAPAVVVVETPAADTAPDGLLAVLLELKAEQTRQAAAIELLAGVAVAADAKADTALAQDETAIETVIEAQADAAEPVEPDVAPVQEPDEAPHKSHWLHR